MATDVVQDVDLYVNQYDFASQVNKCEVTAEAEEVDVTNMESAGWSEQLAGLKKGLVTFDGFASHGSGEASTVLQPVDGLVGTTGIVVGVSYDNVENEPAWLMQCGSYTWQAGAAVGSVEPLTAKFVPDSGSKGMVSGRVNAAKASRTSSTTSTGYQHGAVVAGTNALYSGLFVFSASGTSPTLDVIIQSDDNSGFSSATTRITHSQATAAGVELSSLATAVTDDYWRASWTIGGSDTPTFSFAVITALAAV